MQSHLALREVLHRLAEIQLEGGLGGVLAHPRERLLPVEAALQLAPESLGAPVAGLEVDVGAELAPRVLELLIRRLIPEFVATGTERPRTR